MYSITLVLLLQFHLLLAEEVKVLNVKSYGNPELYKGDLDHLSKKYEAGTALIPIEVLPREFVAASADGHPLTLLPPVKTIELLAAGNPLLAALLLSYSLGIAPKSPGYNHPQHLPLNPYISLLLSHYGKYVPVHGQGRGIYGYAASNNYHNNLPFGSYKIYEGQR